MKKHNIAPKIRCAHDKTVLISLLKPNPRNPNTHPEAQVEILAKILTAQGWRNPIVVSKRSGFIVNGHGRLLAAQKLGLLEVPVNFQAFDSDGQEWAHLVADNKIAELAETDEATLKAIIEELGKTDLDMGLLGLGDETLARLLAEINPPQADDEHAAELIDKAAELQKKWKVKLGQIWEMGEHRLMCGDSTSKEDVNRLMVADKAHLIVTDPPYGVDYKGGTTERKKLSGDANPDLYAPIMVLAAAFSDEASPVYLWHSDIRSAEVLAAVSAAGYERRCTLIWNKNMAQFGALGAQYKTKHEPCYYLFKKRKSPRWFGPTNEVTVWDVDRNAKNEHHPTEKPVEVTARPIRNSSRVGNLVLDFFSGSGTTIIACEQLNRRCRAMEIAPEYVAVALQRWADLTGKTPKLCSTQNS